MNQPVQSVDYTAKPGAAQLWLACGHVYTVSGQHPTKGGQFDCPACDRLAEIRKSVTPVTPSPGPVR